MDLSLARSRWFPLQLTTSEGFEPVPSINQLCNSIISGDYESMNQSINQTNNQTTDRLYAKFVHDHSNFLLLVTDHRNVWLSQSNSQSINQQHQKYAPELRMKKTKDIIR
jgi:hypothetical protein